MRKDKLKGHPTRKYESLLQFMLRIKSGTTKVIKSTKKERK